MHQLTFWTLMIHLESVVNTDLIVSDLHARLVVGSSPTGGNFC